jgi:hypothetical protein
MSMSMVSPMNREWLKFHNFQRLSILGATLSVVEAAVMDLFEYGVYVEKRWPP